MHYKGDRLPFGTHLYDNPSTEILQNLTLTLFQRSESELACVYLVMLHLHILLTQCYLQVNFGLQLSITILYLCGSLKL